MITGNNYLSKNSALSLNASAAVSQTPSPTESIDMIKTVQGLKAEVDRLNIQLEFYKHSSVQNIHRQQELSKSKEPSSSQTKIRNRELEFKVSQMNHEINDNLKQIDSLNIEIEKLRKQNVIDRESRNRKSMDNLRINDGSKSRYSGLNNSPSRISDLQFIDHERLSLKIIEKTKQYEMLYTKYHNLENEFNSIEEINEELMRQHRMLQQKISKYQIHTEGDEVGGELQNKLVLMASEVMRLGSLSRSKVQQTKELTIKIKQLILRNQHLQKDIIEKDKINFNYKQELRILEGNQLTIKLQINSYEQKIVLLAQQNQRLNLLIRNHTAQNSQSNVLRNELEVKSSRIAELQMVGSQKGALKQELEVRDKRIRQLQRENESLIFKQERHKEDNEELRGKLRSTVIQERETESWEFKVRQLGDQIEGLRTQLLVKDELIANISERYQRQCIERSSLLRQKEEMSSRIKVDLMSNEKESKENISKELKHFTQKSMQDARLIRELEDKVSEHQSIYSTFSEEIMRLNEVLNENTQKIANYRKENDFLQHKVRTCEESLSVRRQASEKSIEAQQKSKTQMYQGKIRSFEGQIEVLKQGYNQMRQTNHALENKLNAANNQKQISLVSLKLQINNYEEKLVMLAQQNERLNLLVKNHTTQNSQMIILRNELEVKSSRIAELQMVGSQKGALKQELEVRDKRIRQLQRENESLIFKQERHKEDNEELRGKLRSTVIQERETESWEFKVRQLGDQIEGLRTQLLVKDELIANISERYQRQCIERSSLLRQKEEMSSRIKVDLMSNEKESKENISKELKHFTQKSMQDARLIRELEDKVSEHQSIYSTFSEEIMRLNEVLNENTQKIANYRKENDFLQHKVRTCEESLSVRRQASEKSIEAQQKSKTQMYQGKIRSFEGQIEVLKQGYNQMRQTNHALENKLNAANNQKSFYETKINHYKYQVSEKTQNFKKVEDGFKQTILQIKRSNERLEQSLNQIENHYITKLQSSEKQISQLRRQKKEVETQLVSNEQQIKKYKEVSIRSNTEEGKAIQERDIHITQLSCEVKMLREGNNSLQTKLQMITREHERLIQQLEFYKSHKQNNQQDQKLRIIGSYEATIKHLKEQYTQLSENKNKNQQRCTYEFKMNKLKEQFDLINRLIQQYRQENQRLKEQNKVLIAELQQRRNPLMTAHSHFSSPQHSRIDNHSQIERRPINQGKNNQISYQQTSTSVTHNQREENFATMKNKLSEQIDRLNHMNSSLQAEVHDLRVYSSESTGLRKRLEQNLGLMMILFIEIESLRTRVQTYEPLSPAK